MKKSFFFLFLILFSRILFAATDPFSKITVKSQNAVFQKDKNDESLVHLQYNDDVQVTFADESTVSSDHLEIFVRTGSLKKDEKTGPDVEKVVFKDNVCMDRKNQKVRADIVEVFTADKRCELHGHVKIEQIKQAERDVPLVTKCERAELRWDSEEIELIGTDRRPVSTVIELGGKFGLLQKKDKEKTT